MTTIRVTIVLPHLRDTMYGPCFTLTCAAVVFLLNVEEDLA